MFRNRFTVLLTVTVLFAIAVGLHFIGGEKRNKIKNITIMPEDVAIVIQTKNFSTLLDNFNKKNQFNYIFSDVSEWREFFQLTKLVDTLIKVSPELQDILDDNKMTMAARVGINNTLEFIYSFPVYSSGDEDDLLEEIASYQSANRQVSKQKYENFKAIFHGVGCGSGL